MEFLIWMNSAAKVISGGLIFAGWVFAVCGLFNMAMAGGNPSMQRSGGSLFLIGLCMLAFSMAAYFVFTKVMVLGAVIAVIYIACLLYALLRFVHGHLRLGRMMQNQKAESERIGRQRRIRDLEREVFEE